MEHSVGDAPSAYIQGKMYIFGGYFQDGSSGSPVKVKKISQIDLHVGKTIKDTGLELNVFSGNVFDYLGRMIYYYTEEKIERKNCLADTEVGAISGINEWSRDDTHSSDMERSFDGMRSSDTLEWSDCYIATSSSNTFLEINFNAVYSVHEVSIYPKFDPQADTATNTGYLQDMRNADILLSMAKYSMRWELCARLDSSPPAVTPDAITKQCVDDLGQPRAILASYLRVQKDANAGPLEICEIELKGQRRAMGKSTT